MSQELLDREASGVKRETTPDRLTPHPSPLTAAVPLFDAYAPSQIAVRVREVGVAKATASIPTMVALAVLAGAFISLGSLFYTVTITAGPAEAAPFGLTRLAGGVTFIHGDINHRKVRHSRESGNPGRNWISGQARNDKQDRTYVAMYSLGLILVVVGGAELFTGNNLIAMAWAAGRISLGQVLRNWFWVYLGNLFGSLGTALLVLLAGVHGMADGAVGEMAIRIARGKVALDPVEAVARGMLCNVLVCLAVWLCMGARSVADKILAIIFPISAFVACGFEHSVANMYFLPIGLALTWFSPAPIALSDALSNLLLVTVGNILGGTFLVALVYWFIYLRSDER